MNSESKATVEAFESLGVATKTQSGELRNNKEVFFEVIDALGQMKNETERDALAMQIFGKSATELNPLIVSGASELSRLSDEAHEVGAVLSQETLDSFNQLNDASDKLKKTGRNVFNELGVALLDSGVVADITDTVQELAEQFMNWIANEDNKKKIQELATSIKTDLGVALNAIKTFVTWFMANKDAVIAGIVAIGAGFVAWNVASVILGVVGAVKTLITALQAGKNCYASS